MVAPLFAHGRSPIEVCLKDVVVLTGLSRRVLELKRCGLWPVPVGRTVYRVQFAREGRWYLLPETKP